MKAIEVTGNVDAQGNLNLDAPIGEVAESRVRVIILVPDAIESVEIDVDDTSIEEVEASLKRALQQAKSGQRLPLSQMWEDSNIE